MLLIEPKGIVELSYFYSVLKTASIKLD